MLFNKTPFSEKSSNGTSPKRTMQDDAKPLLLEGLHRLKQRRIFQYFSGYAVNFDMFQHKKNAAGMAAFLLLKYGSIVINVDLKQVYRF